jgi:hypothetical protein
MRRWYRGKGGHVSKPTQQDETKTWQEYEALFPVEEPLGEDITINIDPFSFDENIPNEEETRKVSFGNEKRESSRWKWNYSWISTILEEGIGTRKPKNGNIGYLEKVVEPVQMVFTEEPLPKVL